QPPLKLFLDGKLFGTIVTYGYETPWAVGQLEAADQNHLRPMIEVCELSAEIESWPDLDSRKDEARWQAALDSRGITEADFDQHSNGPWIIETPDGLQHEIFLPVFDRQGFVTWRW
ncbi:MAG: hypothetical protein M3347_11400, partial [Armatimonadota bacterium]|nr:hypothetical protein [Armatimonadota bacterium]